jgi:hypothetical protein
LETVAAIKIGLIERKPCEVCGDKNSQVHHPDYTDSMKVTWLCRKHHLEAHGKVEKVGVNAKRRGPATIVHLTSDELEMFKVLKNKDDRRTSEEVSWLIEKEYERRFGKYHSTPQPEPAKAEA